MSNAQPVRSVVAHAGLWLASAVLLVWLIVGPLVLRAYRSLPVYVEMVLHPFAYFHLGLALVALALATAQFRPSLRRSLAAKIAAGLLLLLSFAWLVMLGRFSDLWLVSCTMVLMILASFWQLLVEQRDA